MRKRFDISLARVRKPNLDETTLTIHIYHSCWSGWIRNNDMLYKWNLKQFRNLMSRCLLWNKARRHSHTSKLLHCIENFYIVMKQTRCREMRMFAITYVLFQVCHHIRTQPMHWQCVNGTIAFIMYNLLNFSLSKYANLDHYQQLPIGVHMIKK